MATKGAHELALLTLAIQSVEIPCAADDRYVMDEMDAQILAPICAPCPVFDLCRAYALKAKPEGGIWAGRRWDVTPRKSTTTKENQ